MSDTKTKAANAKGAAPQEEEVDIYRKTWVRYMGYANEGMI